MEVIINRFMECGPKNVKKGDTVEYNGDIYIKTDVGVDGGGVYFINLRDGGKTVFLDHACLRMIKGSFEGRIE